MASNCKEVTPYWSTREGEDRYHVCGNCSTGDNIQPDYKKSGSVTPVGYKLCETCVKIRAGELTR
jgi:hypothetical protein